MPSPFTFPLTATSDGLLNLTGLRDEILASSIARLPTDASATKIAGVWNFSLSFSPDLSSGEETVLNGLVAAHVGAETVSETNGSIELTQNDVGVANGIPSLDSGGKIPASMVPSVALPEVFVVANAAARTALSPQEGDEAIQTDDGSNWIWDGSAWQQRPTGTGDVVGPASATDNAFPRFDGIGGKTIKNSQTTEDGAGNLTVVGTVNGRNVGNDGTKLDGIEAGATQDQNAAEVPFTPNGDIAANNVQAAVQEVRDDTDGKLAGKLNTSHEGAGGAVHAVATPSTAGFQSAADKTKLDGIEAGAEQNDVGSVFGRTGAVTAQASDYDANQIDYNNATSGLTATNVQAAIDEVAAGGGGAEDAEYFGAGDATGLLNVPTSWVDIPLDTQFRVDAPFSHTPGSAEVTANFTGKALLIAEVTTQNSSGNARSQCEMRVLRNGTEIPVTRAGMYAREVNEGTNTGSVSRPIDITSGDVFKMQAERTSGNGPTRTVPNGSRLTLIRIQGPKGDPGAPGAGGVELQNEGVAVSGGPFSTINVVGPNAAAADAGSGVATLTVQPERFFAKSDPEQNTSSTAFVTAHTLNFTVAVDGTFDLKWYAEVGSLTTNTFTRCQMLLDGAQIAFGDIFVGNNTTCEAPWAGFDEAALTAGPHTLTIQYSVGSGGPARIRRCRLRAEKVAA